MYAGRRRPQRAAAAIGATVLLLTASAAGAKAADLSTCMDQSKSEALQVRELQTHLMVAALSCDAAPEYNAFVKRFTPVLVKHAEQLRRYFAATYGPDGGSHLNRFVTEIANRVSQISATRPSEFCARTVELFRSARADTLPNLLPVEARTISLDGKSCRVAVR
jgi:hypothetical protein